MGYGGGGGGGGGGSGSGSGGMGPGGDVMGSGGYRPYGEYLHKHFGLFWLSNWRALDNCVYLPFFFVQNGKYTFFLPFVWALWLFFLCEMNWNNDRMIYDLITFSFLANFLIFCSVVIYFCIVIDMHFSHLKRKGVNLRRNKSPHKKVTKLIRIGGKKCICRFAALHKTGSVQNGKYTLL